MIHYLVTSEHPYTINEYLANRAFQFCQEIQPLHYDQMALARRLQPGVYIFSDLERLDAAYLQLAQNAWDALNAAGDCVTLNNPRRVLRRGPLLSALHRAGKNPFAVHRLEDDLQRVRFPVFIRVENSHDGAMTGLLDSRDALAGALAQIRGRGVRGENLLVVEYCDTSDTQGIFRKYGAFRVGGRIIPRHILVSRDWMLKYPDRVDAGTVEEERKYMTENPHRAGLEEIFELAGIDYGRIDYAVLDGRIVTWEINTNPTIVVPRERLAESREALQPLFMNPFAESLRALEKPCSAGPIALAVSPELIGRLKLRRGDRAVRAARKRIGTTGKRILRKLSRSKNMDR